ncbi:hypothetical protein GCM10023340_29110 [Nocardioides marinquilinus]|uniref:Acyltransferase 3 domain-containing protein n=1 Tax=Nocardioides marinquilinus TaxID=1210400 RepID=A0ABP9PRM2_9ACTN
MSTRPDARPATHEATAARQAWADVAKGACIVLVVLWHVTRKDYLALPWSLDVPVTGAWGWLSQALLPVRMPLFFAISGLFAARRLAEPWGRLGARRVAPLLYLFVLWTLVHTLVLRLTPGFDTAVAGSPGELLVQLTVTPGNLWYLLALAAYVAVARATRRAPHVALVAAAGLAVVAGAGLVATPGNREGLLVNLVWFLLGTRVAALPRTLTRRRVGVAAVVAFGLATVAWQGLDADRWLDVRPGLGLLGIAAGAGVAVLVAPTRVGTPLARLGRLTLPVYVVHLPLVALLHLASERWLPTSSVVAALLYPAAATALVLALSLALHRVLVRAGGWWLFTAPWLGRA